MLPPISVLDGSLISSVSWERGPPGVEPTIILKRPLSDGGLMVFALEDLLIVELWEWDCLSEQPLDQLVSPPLLRHDRQIEIVSIAWKERRLVDFYISGQQVPRDPYQTLDLRREEQISAYLRQPLPRVSAPLPSNIYRHLHQTTTRLERSLQSVRSDNVEALLDLAVHLRTLVTPYRREEPLLLAACRAAAVSPVIYTASGLLKVDALPIIPLGAALFDASASPVPWPGMSTEVNLFDWLDGPALLTRIGNISHIKLIKEVADQAGAHADLQISDILASLLDTNSEGFDLTILVGQMRQYALLVGTVAKSLLGSGPSHTPRLIVE